MNIDNETRLLSHIISNFVMEVISVEQFFVLLNPA